MSASPEGSDLIDLIQARLEGKGWRTEAGAGWRWVDHTFTSDHAELRVRYLPDNDQIRLDFESEDHLGQILIDLADSPDPILDLIFEYESTLSPETWRAFITVLLDRSPRVQAIAIDGETQEQEVIRMPDEGVTALREVEWE
jgi:hypothetical protein